MHEARTLENHDFDALYRDHAEKLWRALLSYTGDPEVASDATAEAFAQCLARGADVHSPAAWIWRAAFRIAAGQFKDARKTTTLSEPDSNLQSEESPDIGLFLALNALPPRQRAALTLYYYVGFSTRDIASILDLAVPTVRVHLNRARRKLRRILEEANHE